MNTDMKQARQRTSRLRSWTLFVIAIICIAPPVVAAFASTPSWLPELERSLGFQQQPIRSAAQLTRNEVSELRFALSSSSVSPEVQAGSKKVVEQYMQAFLAHNYTGMWSLLPPEMQEKWPTESAFASFWPRRFAHYTAQSFTSGTPRWLNEWTDPETMHTYTHVLEMPVSLSITADQQVQHDPLAAPEHLNPQSLYQNVPFILQQVNNATDQWQVLEGGPVDPEAPILPPLHPVLKYVKVPIMMYHHISDQVQLTALGKSLTVPSKMFTQQLDYLQHKGYHTITFNQLFNALYFSAPLPDNPIILTFDDGYDDAYNVAAPILKAHNFSGMFYIITGKVGWKGYVNWNQVRALLIQGMQIGSHTVHHVDMGATLAYSKTIAQQELQQSKATLEQQLGMPIQQFCYPSGEPFRHGSLFLRHEIMALLASDGYVGATTDPGATGVYQNNQLPFMLLRIRVDGRSSLKMFELSLPPPQKVA